MNTTNIEAEITLYARLKDFNQLKLAESVERHEQYEFKLEKGETSKTRFRIRKTTTDGKDKHEITVKVTDLESGNLEETNAATSETVFNLLKTISTQGMFKDRYRFPFFSVNGKDVYLEVDAYPDLVAGVYQPWVKIDIEFPVDNKGVVFPENMDLLALPFEYHELLNGLDVKNTTAINKIYEKYFLSAPKI